MAVVLKLDVALFRQRLRLIPVVVPLDVVDDELTVQPPEDGRLRPAAIDTYDDHRMAMSFALAGTKSAGVRINDPACVNKTYPEYFQDLEKLRAQVS